MIPQLNLTKLPHYILPPLMKEIWDTSTHLTRKTLNLVVHTAQALIPAQVQSTQGISQTERPAALQTMSMIEIKLTYPITRSLEVIANIIVFDSPLSELNLLNRNLSE